MNPDSSKAVDRPRPGDRNRKTTAIAVLGLALTFASSAGLAAPGDLDTSFGGGGIVLRQVNPYYSYGYASALQPNGNLLVGGTASINAGPTNWNMAMIRQAPNGAPDTTFGGGTGEVIVHTGPTFSVGSNEGDEISGVVVQPNGAIVTAGYNAAADGHDSEDALVRYNANGTLDTSFGSGGGVISQWYGNSIAYDVALQADQKIVTVGVAGALGSPGNMVVARYLGNGSFDTSFGNSFGAEILQLPNTTGCWAHSVAIARNGNIVVVGGAGITGSSQQVVFIARLTPSGALDTTFGTGGVVITNITPYFSGPVVALVLDQKIVIATPTATGSTIARYTVNGSPDTTFNGTGYQTIAGAYVTSLAVLPSFEILVSGYTDPSATRFYVARYTTTGALDTTFTNSSGSQGAIVTPIPNQPQYNAASGLAVAPGGGFTVTGTSGSFMSMVRYLGSPQSVNPSPVSFVNVTGAAPSTVQISNTITISGLSPAATSVPVAVTGGSYSVDGAAFITTQSSVRNGAQIMVKNTSPATSGASTTTTLKVGGMYPRNNAATVLGTPITATFTSTTR